MARLKPNCLCIRPVILFALFAMFGLAFMPPPVMANDGPDHTINPNHTTGDDTPWGEYADHPAFDAFIGPRYRVQHVSDRFMDIGIFEDNGRSAEHQTDRGDTANKAGDDKQDPGNSR